MQTVPSARNRCSYPNSLPHQTTCSIQSRKSLLSPRLRGLQSVCCTWDQGTFGQNNLVTRTINRYSTSEKHLIWEKNDRKCQSSYSTSQPASQPVSQLVSRSVVVVVVGKIRMPTYARLIGTPRQIQDTKHKFDGVHLLCLLPDSFYT